MEQDVRVQGDLIEFLRQFKCEACQNRDRKCLLQINDERCMLCSDADRQCVFSRTVQIRGPKKAFEWRTLLGTETVIGAKLNGHTEYVYKELLRAAGAVNLRIVPHLMEQLRILVSPKGCLNMLGAMSPHIKVSLPIQKMFLT